MSSRPAELAYCTLVLEISSWRRIADWQLACCGIYSRRSRPCLHGLSFGRTAIVASRLTPAISHAASCFRWTGDVGEVSRGALVFAVACFCWAIENNLTRKVSASDAIVIVGAVNVPSRWAGLEYAMPSGGSMSHLNTCRCELASGEVSGKAGEFHECAELLREQRLRQGPA